MIILIHLFIDDVSHDVIFRANFGRSTTKDVESWSFERSAINGWIGRFPFSSARGGSSWVSHNLSLKQSHSDESLVFFFA